MPWVGKRSCQDRADQQSLSRGMRTRELTKKKKKLIHWNQQKLEIWTAAQNIGVRGLAPRGAIISLPIQLSNSVPCALTDYGHLHSATSPSIGLSPFLIQTGRRGIQVGVGRAMNCFLACMKQLLSPGGKLQFGDFCQRLCLFVCFLLFQLCKFEFHKHLGMFLWLQRIPTLLISF